MAYLNDGYQTLVTFSEALLTLKEKSVTPPGFDGRGPIDISTMLNQRMVTKWPKSLMDITEMTFTAAYSPEVYRDALLEMQRNQLVTVQFSDGSQVQFYGWIDALKPNELSEGEHPTMDVTVCISNTDAAGDEIQPVYLAAA